MYIELAMKAMKRKTFDMEDHVFSVRKYLEEDIIAEHDLESGAWQLKADGLTARQMWEKHKLLVMDTWLVLKEDFVPYKKE